MAVAISCCDSCKGEAPLALPNRSCGVGKNSLRLDLYCVCAALWLCDLNLRRNEHYGQAFFVASIAFCCSIGCPLSRASLRGASYPVNGSDAQETRAIVRRKPSLCLTAPVHSYAGADLMRYSNLFVRLKISAIGTIHGAVLSRKFCGSEDTPVCRGT